MDIVKVEPEDLFRSQEAREIYRKFRNILDNSTNASSTPSNDSSANNGHTENSTTESATAGMAEKSSKTNTPKDGANIDMDIVTIEPEDLFRSQEAREIYRKFRNILDNSTNASSTP